MHFHRRLQIDCTPAALWRCLTEPALIKEWVSQMEDETPEDPAKTEGVGAVSTMRLREGGKLVSYRCVVTAWEPRRRLAVRLSGGSFAPGMEMDVVYELSNDEMARTTLDYDVQVPLVGLFYKLLAPLIWLMAASNAKKDLAKLCALAPTVSG